MTLWSAAGRSGAGRAQARTVTGWIVRFMRLLYAILHTRRLQERDSSEFGLVLKIDVTGD